VGRALKAAGAFVRSPEVLDIVAAASSKDEATNGAASAPLGSTTGDGTDSSSCTSQCPSLAAADPLPGERGDAYDGGDADGMALPGEVSHAPSRVLMLEFIDGFKITDKEKLQENGADPTQLLLGVCEAFGVQMHLLGLFNGDPHPGNIMVERVLEGEEAFVPGSHDAAAGALRPVLLDFGLAKQLKESSRIAFCEMVQASFLNDFASLSDSFDRMGMKLRREQPMEDMIAVRFLLRDVEPPAKARARMLKQHKWMAERRKEREAAKQRRPIEAFPGDLLFYLRTSELLHGLGSALGAELPYLSVIGGYGRLALRAYYRGVDVLCDSFRPAAVHLGQGDGNACPFDGEGPSIVELARSIQTEGGAWAPAARASLAKDGLLAGEMAER